MILTNIGAISIKGSKAEIKADLSVIASTLKGECKLPREEILEAINRGLDDALDDEAETQEESIVEENIETAVELLRKVNSLMEEVITKGGKKDE